MSKKKIKIGLKFKRIVKFQYQHEIRHSFRESEKKCESEKACVKSGRDFAH